MPRATIFSVRFLDNTLTWFFGPGAFALCLAAACASGPSTPSPAVIASSTAIEPSSPSGLLRPDQIIAILENSGIDYHIVSDGVVTGGQIAAMIPGSTKHTGPMDPFVEVDTTADGRPHLKSTRPSPALTELFEYANSAFEARDYEAARTFYARAIQLEPDYFKTYTYLGNSLYLLGDYRRAEVAFEMALSMNPIDYQALLFLGDTYYQLGDYGRSKAMLTRAFMLNRSNPVVRDRLRASLAKLRLRIRSRRLTPNVRIKETRPGHVEIHLDQNKGMRWLALAACMACWKFEDQCRQRSPEADDPLRLSMYRECLINQAASIAVRKAQDEMLRTDEQQLLDAIEDGYLEAIIFWEVIAGHAPVVILLLPERVQRDILQYIEKYVFVSTQVV